ncbi:hypothetical protein M0811_00512 [Anaeramoeba ignava]|uniref:Regulator of chromosome condensation n=1 Tax=Anaeramoeba ignava TaxID=1746090 RepID=A0A9Q0LQK0_ANAIG|nr:hypothetical protein M0811_00512 [Anaeramoeba ignava]
MNSNSNFNFNQKNDIWIFGQNPFFNRFSDDPYQITKPHQMTTVNLQEEPIKQIASNKFITNVLFISGEVIQFIVGLDPKKLKFPKIKKISVGIENEALLSEKGQVFIRQNRYKTKISRTYKEITLLIEDTNDRIIQDVVSGKNTIYLLTSNQNAYGIGSNDHGQLSCDSETLKKTEKPILMMKNVSKIFSGNFSNCVFILNSNQELFCCGDNFFGQLGLGKSIKEAKVNQLTKNPKYSKRQNN